MAANVLGVFPELRMHIVYVMMLRDEDLRVRAMRANTAVERAAVTGKSALVAFLREAADALENTEHHHHDDRRVESNASEAEAPGS